MMEYSPARTSEACKSLMSVKKHIADWYRGRPVENNQQIVFLKSYRQHWTARAAHHVVGCGQRFWVGAVFIALIALLYGLQQLF